MVSFPNYHVVFSDTGNPFHAPHWRDDSNPPDGTAVRAHPVAYTRNTKPRVSAKWHIEPAGFNAAFKIRGTAPDGIEFPETAGTVNDNEIFIIVESDYAFANAIGYYDNFEINWEFSINDGDTWHDGGKSSNQVYVTLGDPIQGTTMYQTLIHIGCTNAAGDTDADIAVDSIYSEFTNQKVFRVSDNKQMKYWYNHVQGAQTVSDILSNADGNGNCEAWSALLRDCFRVQGISSDRIVVQPWRHYDKSILVKDWVFRIPSAGGLHPYYVPSEAEPIEGIPAQYTENPLSVFNLHYVTRYNGDPLLLYDPSYGTPKVQSVYYANTSLDGYGNDIPQLMTKARKIDPTENDVWFLVKND